MMKIKATHHGLSDKELNTLKQVLQYCAHKIEKVAIFGSRANANYNHYSDIDLVLYGDLDSEDIKRLNTLFDESSIGLRVDIKGYHLIDYPALKRHIDDHSKLLFSNHQLSHEQM